MSTHRLPGWLLLGASLGALAVLLPIVGLLMRMPWSRLIELLTTQSALDALRLSLLTGVCSAAAAVLLGTPLALLIARVRHPAMTALRALVLIPLVLPPVVSGLALLYTFGRNGWAGQTLGSLGVQVAFSTLAVVIAQTYVSLPFVVMTVENGLRAVNTESENLVRAYGGGETMVLRKVVLPSIRASLLTATVLAFARSLGEFGATLTFAGSLQGVTRTLPLQIYLDRESDPAGAIALSALLMGVAFVTVLVAYLRVPLRAARGVEAGAHPSTNQTPESAPPR